MTILDMICAKYGNEMIGTESKNVDENLITKALGVLQEDGLYAFALYTKSKSGDSNAEKKTAKVVHNKALALLKDEAIDLLTVNCTDDFLVCIRNNLSSNLDALLFAKELLERTLVYARYHAKALGKTEKEGEAQMEGGS